MSKKFLTPIKLKPQAPSAFPTEEGTVGYDNLHHSLAVRLDRTDVLHQVGRELLVRVTNTAGSTITNGTVVNITGSDGHFPTVEPADLTQITSESILGIATNDILDTETGWVTAQGLIHEVDLSSFASGDPLYLSTTAGEVTNIRPPLPNVVVKVGYVINATTSGEGYVTISPLQQPEVHQKVATEIFDNTTSINYLSSSSQAFHAFSGTGGATEAGFSFRVPVNYAGEMEMAIQWVMDGTSTDQARIAVNLGIKNDLSGGIADTVDDETLEILDNGQASMAWQVQVTPFVPVTSSVQPGDTLLVEIEREPNNANDVMTETFYMMNFLIRYRT